MAPVALFDLDNTLFDRAAAFRRWAERFADQHGLGDEGSRWFCATDDDGLAERAALFGAAKQHFGLPQTVAELVAAYRRDYPAYFAPAGPAIAALTSLRRAGWLIGVVTNGPPSQHEKLSRAGLTGLVDVCCVSEELGWDKPDPRIFQEAVRRCGGDLRSGQVWMVGDAPVPDIGGGRRVGCRTIWLHRGRTWTVEEYAPDVIVGSVGEAADVLLTSGAGLRPRGGGVPASGRPAGT